MELVERRSYRFRKSHQRQTVWRAISAVAIGLALVFALLLGWFSPVYIADPSMAPTLQKGDTVLYDRVYKHFIPLQRSDMVAFSDPASGALLIKLETVSAEDGLVIIDGQFALSESDYLLPAPFAFDPVTVPEGCVFVLSDDRNYGEDSRNAMIGCIPEADVLGVVRIRLDRFTFFASGD